MGGKEEAQKQLEEIRELANKIMQECFDDAMKIATAESSFIPHNEDRIANVAFKLFDVRWEAFVHDSDAGLFEE